MTVIEKTSAICPRCATPHPAELVREGDCVAAVTHCHEGDVKQEVSSDAELFLALRAKSAARDSAAGKTRNLLNYISITNACDMRCAVCFALFLRYL